MIRYISERYQNPIALGELAEQCGMNSNYFCRAFKEFTGITPVEYLNFYRVESACERILKAEESITEIAFLCGFNDFSYFIKVFKNLKVSLLLNMPKKFFCKANFTVFMQVQKRCPLKRSALLL